MPSTAETLPNGPATLTTDLRKDKIKLTYAGQTVLSATLRLCRGEDRIALREGGARLIAVSKYDGWDRVVQVVRVAAVAMQPGDRLHLKGTVTSACSPPPGEEADESPILSRAGSTVRCPLCDFILTLEPADALSWVDGVKTAFDGEAGEFTITFRPHVSRGEGG